MAGASLFRTATRAPGVVPLAARRPSFPPAVCPHADKSKSCWQVSTLGVHPGGTRGMAVRARARGLPIDMRGKNVFIAGVADDQGFGWQIAKAMAEAGAEISLGVWVPALKIFETSFRRGKFDESRKLSDGSLMDFSHIYAMDAVFDTPQDVPQDIKENKRYAGNEGYTVSEVAEKVHADIGNVDVIVHSLANGPEVKKPLLDTSRSGYLAALSASSYSYISMMQHFGPIMNPGGAAVSLTYLAAARVIPGYGGGMSSAKAALESDTKVLAYEAGRKHGVRVNTISAGPLGSRAAKAIGFIDAMINYSYANAPMKKELQAREVGNVAAFLCSDLASAVTGHVMYVDNGLNVMGVAMDSAQLAGLGGE
jgi:enoyl-[acyl-carrier protein] reductase I